MTAQHPSTQTATPLRQPITGCITRQCEHTHSFKHICPNLFALQAMPHLKMLPRPVCPCMHRIMCITKSSYICRFLHRASLGPSEAERLLADIGVGGGATHSTDSKFPAVMQSLREDHVHISWLPGKLAGQLSQSGRSGRSGQAGSAAIYPLSWSLSDRLDFSEFLQRQDSHLQVQESLTFCGILFAARIYRSLTALTSMLFTIWSAAGLILASSA